MRSLDTSAAANRVQIDPYRAMSPTERLELALAMGDELMSVTRAGIRHRHPDFTEDEVLRELHRILGHDELVAERWP